MSTTAGVFSETTLQNIRAMASARMLDGRTKLNFEAQAAVAQIIPKVQTANVSELNAKDKNYTLEVEWINNCAIVAEDCESCATGGPELSTNTQTYKIEHCVQAPFTVKPSSHIDNDFNAQQLVADGILSADKKISEELCHRFLDWLVTNAGVAGWNPGGEIGSVVGNEVQIATADFDIDAIGYMTKVLQYDRISWMNNISGNQLFNDYRNAGFLTGLFEAGTQGDQARMTAFPILFDLYNFNAAAYNDRVISIADGAIAFASKSYYGPTMEKHESKTVWSQASKFFPGLTLEIWMTETCVNDLFQLDFNVKGRYEFVLNPAGCEEDNTGIIQFVRV